MEHVPLARVVRSGFVEGVHHGSAVALDADGTLLLAAGDPHAAVLPRSAVKPLQAVAMLQAGLRLDLPSIALAAASHSGERFHLDGVQRMLAGAGLGVSALRNTPDLPLDEQERRAWLRAGAAPSALAQNCSGKHAAMLVTCVENGWPVRSYPDPEHPLQQAIRQTVADLTGEPVSGTAVDGCGAPAPAVSLLGLARGFAVLATATGGSARYRVAEAIRAHPEWLGGTGREVTALVRGLPGLIAKEGAEGVYAAAAPDGRAVALKIADGADRARSVVLAALLRRLGLDAPVLDAIEAQVVRGGGRPVGAVEALL